MTKMSEMCLLNEFMKLSNEMKNGGNSMGQKKGNIDEILENIKNALDTIQYGTITLVIQDGIVIQMEKNEKIRLK